MCLSALIYKNDAKNLLNWGIENKKLSQKRVTLMMKIKTQKTNVENEKSPLSNKDKGDIIY